MKPVDIAIPFIEPDARFALWGLVTVITAVFTSVWMFVGCTLTANHGPLDLTARVEALVIGIVIAACSGGPALAGGLMIYDASVTGASSVPGGIGAWIGRSAAATALWFSLTLAAASAFERANAILIAASWLLSMAAVVGVLILLGLGS